MINAKFYTYVMIDPRNHEPFYVGKGKGNRMFQHKYTRRNHNNKKLSKRITDILSTGNDITYKKILDDVTEGEAFNKERQFIKNIGREDLGTGPLLNRIAGGQGSAEWSEGRRKEKSETELAKKKGRPISQYDLDGNFVSYYSSAKVASEQVTSANRSYITQCCKGKRKSSGNFLWTYRGDPQPIFIKKYYKQVQQFTLDNKLINTFRSLTEAQKQTGVELHNISECCRHKSKSAGCFIWRYYE